MKRPLFILSLSFLLLMGSCATITPIKGSQYQKKKYSSYKECLGDTTGRYNFSEFALNLFAGFGGLVMMYNSGKADSFWGFLGSSVVSMTGFNKLERVQSAIEGCKDYEEWKKSRQLNLI